MAVSAFVAIVLRRTMSFARRDSLSTQVRAEKSKEK